MMKIGKALEAKASQTEGDDVAKRQRKSVVNTLVKEFCPYKFSAGQLIQKRETAKRAEG